MLHHNHLFPPVFVTAEPNPEGVYCVRWWVDNTWQWVITDSRFIAQKGAHRKVTNDASDATYAGAPDAAKHTFAVPTCAHATDKNTFWTMLLEKTWAKLNGSYSDIFSGTAADALLALLPHAASHVSIDLSANSADADFDTLVDWVTRGWPVCLGSAAADANAGKPASAHAVKGSGESVDEHGIVRSHAFTVERTFVASVAHEPGGKLSILQLRNPWGSGEWNGACSDNDDAFWSPAMCREVGYDPKASGDDGIFWMPYRDLLGRFATASAVRRVHLAGDGGSWIKIAAHGSWHADQKVRVMSDYATSGFDQFVLKPERSGKFIIELNQDSIAHTRALNTLASVDCAVFTVTRSKDSPPATLGLRLTPDDFRKFTIEGSSESIPAVASRIDERISSAAGDEQEEIALEGGQTYSLIPYFSGDLFAVKRGFALTVLSDTPFSLHAVDAKGAATSSGIVDWSKASATAVTQYQQKQKYVHDTDFGLANFASEAAGCCGLSWLFAERKKRSLRAVASITASTLPVHLPSQSTPVPSINNNEGGAPSHPPAATPHVSLPQIGISESKETHSTINPHKAESRPHTSKK